MAVSTTSLVSYFSMLRAAAVSIVVVFLCALPAQAQVQVQYDGSEIVITNAENKVQRAVRTFGKSNADWAVEDEVGNSYQAGCRSTCSQNTDGSWTCSGFLSNDGVDPSIVEGYEDALQHLVDNYGAVIEHDPVAGIDVVSFPDADDPYDLLATALLNDYVNGRLLVEYFKSLELNSLGVTGGKYAASKPRGRQLRFPDDPYFTSQWNLFQPKLLRAQMLPIRSKKRGPVKVAILDAGINDEDAHHPGLDGVGDVKHIWTAPSTGFSDAHGLAVTTLLADGGNDGDGPIGLMGGIESSCRGGGTVFSRYPVELLSYSVGAWGPMTNFVVSALHQAVKVDEADIILMNFRMGYSPLVEEAIEEAVRKGVILIAAAGNYHPSRKAKPVGFPASVDGVVSVGSANRGKKQSRFSAEGADILAPGEDIVVGLSEGWVYGSGTSFAAPHVAATAALVKLANPDIGPAEFEELLKETASGSRSRWSRNWWRQRRGNQDAGFLDALGAVKSVLRSQRWDDDDDDDDFEWDEIAECDFDKAGSLAVAEDTESGTAELIGNFPNPFNPSTQISFNAPAAGTATLTVANMLGQQVRQRHVETAAGQNSISFSGEGLPTGTYLYRVSGDGWVLQGRMMLLK